MGRAAIIAVTVTAAVGGIVLTTTPGGGGGGSTANLWVDTSGGTCTRQSTAGVYSDAGACATFNAAVDAATSGDTIRVRPGTYVGQAIDGDKTSLTRIIADGDGDDVIVSTVGGNEAAGFEGFSWCAICIDSNNVSVENLKTLTDSPSAFGSIGVWGTNNQAVNTTNRGAVSNDPDPGDFYPASIGVNGTNFTMTGGSIGNPDTPETVTCDQSSGIEPIWLKSGGSGVTIDGVTIGRYESLARADRNGGGDPCSGGDTWHLEDVRIDDTDNVTIKNSTFKGPSQSCSARIFTSSDPDNVKIINNVFEDRDGCAGAVIDYGVGFGGSDWYLLYNTWLEGGISVTGGVSPSGSYIFAGNYGEQLGCGGTQVKNVHVGSGSCGTNTYIGATSLGLDANNRLQAGSPAVDAAETPGASDWCTDSATVNSADIDGTVRPQGSVCDAGADER